MGSKAGPSSAVNKDNADFKEEKKSFADELNKYKAHLERNSYTLEGSGLKKEVGDKKPKAETPKPTVDAKPKLSHQPGSSHVYGIPSNTFTEKTQAAEGKIINLDICDPDGNTYVFNVWNKAPISQSIFKRYGDLVNYNIKELRFMVDGRRVHSIHADGTWYTAVDLDLEDGGSVDIFKQQDGGAEKC